VLARCPEGLEQAFTMSSLLQKSRSIRNSGAGLLAFKRGCSVLEKLFLPLVKHCRLDLLLVAQIGGGYAFNQMLANDGDLCSGLK
jgi:hypothetical protein